MEIYKQALAHYLRRGVPVRVSLKEAAHPTTHYIWRTRSDGKVCASHAVNNGKIFAWNDPPATGHPGEDWGCRCVAEAYYEEKREFAEQRNGIIIDGNGHRWSWEDFITHFYFGEGKAVELSKIGHLQEVVDHVQYHHGIYDRVNQQIVSLVRSLREGNVPYHFSNSYDFKPVSYPHGFATVSGEFSGKSKRLGNFFEISGIMTYRFLDLFTDPVRLRDKIFNGTSDPRAVNALWLEISDLKGTYFIIHDSWKSYVSITAKQESYGSIFS